MKKIIKYGFGILLSLFVWVGCNPQEDNLHSLGTPDSVKDLDVTFTSAPTAKSANEIVFTNTTVANFPVTVVWDLGNGAKGTGGKVTGVYPEKGDYNVALTLYAADGSSASKSMVIHLEDDDYGLVNTPAYSNLTGGMDKPEGKIWVFDQYNNFAK
ncbi:MAG: PKD domain-containing protein, partial [Petrimonas sp.]|nr:PKD domain-containing protein [Petrimonas sp.]